MTQLVQHRAGQARRGARHMRNRQLIAKWAYEKREGRERDRAETAGWQDLRGGE